MNHIKTITPEQPTPDGVEAAQRKNLLKSLRPAHWNRILAFLIDMPIILILCAGIEAVFGLAQSDAIMGVIGDLMLGSFFYHLVCEMSPKHATIGKIFFGMMVIRLDGQPLTILDLIKRTFTRYLNWGTFGISYSSAIFSPTGQTCHDFVSKTMVIKRSLQSAEIEQIKATSGLGKYKYERILMNVLFSFSILYFFSILIVSTAIYYSRQEVTKGYMSIRPTVKYVDDFYRKNNKFPQTLDNAPSKTRYPSDLIDQVHYQPEDGTLLVTFNPTLGVTGNLYIEPVQGIYMDNPSELVWVCSGVNRFTPVLLPNGCTSRVELELKKAHHAPDNGVY